MTTNRHPEQLAYSLIAIIVICATVLVALGKEVPTFFAFIGTTAIGAAAGVSLPRAPARSTDQPAASKAAR